MTAGLFPLAILLSGCTVPTGPEPPRPRAGIYVYPVSGHVVSESGTTVSFSVVLTTAPHDVVTINLSCSDPTEASVDPIALHFDSGNWQAHQTVTVRGLDDQQKDGNVVFFVALEPCISADGSYAGVDGDDVEILCVDDETPGVALAGPVILITTESGGTASVPLMLSSPPAADVTLELESDDPTEGSVQSATLIFTPGDWMNPQTVTVTGVDDTDVDGFRTYRVVLKTLASPDAEYNGMNPDDLLAVNIDNDVRITAGSRFSSWIKEDGSLWIWGLPIGLGDIPPRCYPTPSDTGNLWCMVRSGTAHSVGLRTDRTLWAWGENEYGQLGDGTISDKTTPQQVGSDDDWAYTDAGGGGYSYSGHTVAIKNDGTLWTWGSGYEGQLGTGYHWSQTVPLKVGTEQDWVFVSAGMRHTMAIKSDGSLWAFGDNSWGKLGDGTLDDAFEPVRIGTDTDWIAVLAGANHTVALKTDGSLWAWGSNGNGELGDGTTTATRTPKRIGTVTDWRSVAAGSGQTMAIREDGSLWGWGWNRWGKLGDDTTDDRYLPIRIGTDNDWVLVTAGSEHVLALKSGGSVWTWGNGGIGELGDGTAGSRYVPTRCGTDSDWSALYAGQSHIFGIKSSGVLLGWGSNHVHQLGYGSVDKYNTPGPVNSDTDWSVLSGGNDHTMAVKNDGTLWGWGDNRYGELGNGTVVGLPEPTRIGSSSDWESVAAGSDYTLALKTDGSLWGWGRNDSGQLGDGTTTGKRVPKRIGTDADWHSIHAGASHSSAIKDDGTLWGWGRNLYVGAVGDGTTENRTSPVRIGSDNDWSIVAPGYLHTVAIRTDGSLWAWGDNGTGQLGDGTTEDRYSPVRIGNDTDWTAVSAGGDNNRGHSLALKSDGSLWAWGYGGSGQLGDDTGNGYHTPIRIGNDTDWVAVTAFGYSSAALKSDGSLWTWGSNYSGQLGHGDTWRATPAPVP